MLSEYTQLITILDTWKQKMLIQVQNFKGISI